MEVRSTRANPPPSLPVLPLPPPQCCPDAWRHVNLRKMLLPRLYSLLRHGCYGSAAVSLPALLPLLPLLPPGTLGPDPGVLVSVLDAVWVGMQDPSCGGRWAPGLPPACQIAHGP